MNYIKIRKPDDFHIHLRQDDMLSFTLQHASNNFNRVLVMPNLSPPLIHTCDVKKYYNEIHNILTKNNWKLTCLMTLYLTEETSINDIIEAKESKIIYSCKLYPKNGTTNSNNGVNINNIHLLFPIFEKMSELDIILCIHGELNNDDIDIFDRERIFMKNILPNIINNFPKLKIILEHITTKESVEFIKQCNDNVAATITPQHLISNRNDMLSGGIKPHYYCLPILKRKEDQQILIEAATSGDKHFFIGTDSAPHTRFKKECDCGCAGCFTGYNPIELYIDVFYKYGKIENIEKFTSENGAKFYNLPLSDEYVIYEKKDKYVPQMLFTEIGDCIIPFYSGNKTNYSLKK